MHQSNKSEVLTLPKGNDSSRFLELPYFWLLLKLSEMFLITECLLSQSSVKGAAHLSWVTGLRKSKKDKPLPSGCPGTSLPA